MSPLHIVFILLLSSAFTRSQEPDYEAGLQRAIKLYPPGDYNERPVRRFEATTVIEKAKVAPTFDLLEPVESSDKDIKTLFSEAASYFTSGRWDLSAKRYRQLLLSDPENLKAKANLYDIMVLRALYSDDTQRNEAAQKHSEMRDRFCNDIIPKE